MQALIVEFRIHAAFADAFAAAIAANAQASRDMEPGCRQFDVCRETADPTFFFLYELYDDEAAVQAHLKAPHFLAMDALTRDWVASKKVLRMQRWQPA